MVEVPEIMRGGVQLKHKNNIERNGEMQREAGAGLGWAGPSQAQLKLGQVLC